MSAVQYTPSPVDFGAPAKFSEWRDGQDSLFWDVLDCKKRFSIHNAPVGCGKSLAYVTAALAEGKRTAFLTESKGLQDQLIGDFGAVGLFDMRGLSNYTCRALTEGGLLETLWQKRWGRPTCDVGPCTAGIRCDLKNEGCDYFDDYRKACSSKLVCTNYAYWIAIHRYGQGLGKFDLLILDEAHAADSQLSAAMSVEFTEKDFKALKSARPKSASAIQVWRMWGREQLRRIQGKLEFFTEGARIGQTIGPEGVLALIQDTDLPDASELKQWKRLETKCQTLSEAQDDWIVELNDFNGSVRFAPVWVRNYSESALFRSISRVVMMSATVRPKITDLLNIPAQHAEFREYPSTFPVERRPIYWIPTVRMNYEMSQEDLRTWAVRIDNIIAKRLDRKGIVHTVSYERQQYLLAHSRFRHLMYANTTSNTRDVVQSFRNADAPAILVSPSVGTGFDFAFDQARYQVISKIPFRDARGAILKAQVKDDPDYLNYLTAQDLIQMYGRPNRDPKDFSETFILDNNVEWFLKDYAGFAYDKIQGVFNMSRRLSGSKNFFPEYFLAAFRRIEHVPSPPTLDMIAA